MEFEEMEHIHDIDDVIVTLNSLREAPALQAIDLFAHVKHTTTAVVNIDFKAGEGGVDEAAVKEEAKKALTLYVSGDSKSVSEDAGQQNIATLLSPMATHVGGSIKRGSGIASNTRLELTNGAVDDPPIEVSADNDAELMDSTWCLSLAVTHRFLELNEVGPMIDGDLVIQGIILEKGVVPVLCVVDYAADHEEDLNRCVCFVAPWEMILSEGASDNNEGSEVLTQFTIPIKLKEEDYCDGSVRVNIFVGKREEVMQLYSDKEESFLDSTNLSSIMSCSCVTSLEQKYILATSLMTPSRRGEDAIRSSELAVQKAMSGGKKPIVDMKVLFEVDEEYEHLKASGYQDISIMNIASTIKTEEILVGSFNFRVLYRLDDKNGETGDDVQVINGFEFVEGSKNAMDKDEADGNGGNVTHCESGDLSQGDLTTITLKWHLSSRSDNGGFDSLALLVSSPTSTTEECAVELDAYLSGIDERHIFTRLPEGTRFAQKDDSKLIIHGFLLHNNNPCSPDSHDRKKCVIEEMSSSSSSPSLLPEGVKTPYLSENEEIEKEVGSAPASSNSLGDHSDGDEDDDEEAEEDEVDEELVAEQLEKKVADLLARESSFTLTNSNLQKQCVALIAREKASTNNPGLSSSKRASLENGSIGLAGDNANNTDGASTGDRNTEKESSLNSVLTSITSSRIKIAQQMADYDQLSHDLQTRLDDREFKATEIAESFAVFKREILAKAENTRTNRPLSNRLVRQFAKAQATRDEDLERVRLRNISMRRQLARLEKQLRAREQLAEGLHMIDFEQLKVENQTLYEKIEERTEELTKLKRKKNNTVQVLTHVREKLKCIENNNQTLNSHLSGVENETMSKRGGLTGTKKDRDLIRGDNKELRRKQGFSSSTGLLTDFEKRVKSLGDVKAKISELSDKYDMLAVQVQRDTSLITSMGDASGRRAENQFPFPPGKSAMTIDEREGASGSKTPFFPGAIPDTA